MFTINTHLVSCALVRGAKAVGVIFCILCVLIIAECVDQPKSASPTADLRYRTPIPDATVQAYVPGGYISDHLEAVIAGEQFLKTTRMVSLQPPATLFAERMTLTEAKEKTLPSGQSFDGPLSEDAPVWLVIYKGLWRIEPPFPEETPDPGEIGCVFTIMPENGIGVRTAGTIKCPEEE
ncbi:MAG TPA: hypothetical protein PKW33_00240 [Anaerolineaceae bacterium]|mgnify:CR=1 FL=1|nr:hypothetical protein [Anaerolineaceae bacterium]HPN49985.1 hypothetical protein [Anaerolineaceae bacterium]